jgi:hypothetical protein
MTAPAAEVATDAGVAPVLAGNNATESNQIPEGAAPIRLPVMVVEGMWTADGRYLEPGSLTTRTLPIALYSQTRSSHGSLDGDTATVLAGAITKTERKPGPEVIQLSTGQPFPEGTFVWEGTGWMYTDVPAPPEKSVYTLVKDKALRGNSVDLSDVDAEFEFDEGADPNAGMARIRITQGVIGASTLVGQPAFPDAYIELDGTAMEMAETVTAGGVPMWRAAQVGDVCGPCLAVDGSHDAIIAAALGETGAVEQFAIMDELLGDNIGPDEITPRQTGGMVALVPANPNMLRVPDGDPAEELHLTLAYLGDDVTTWSPEDRAAVLQIALNATDFDAMVAYEAMRAEQAGGNPDEVVRSYREMGRSKAQKGPLDAVIFSHAVFNPNGDNGHDPATVYLLDGTEDRADIEMLASTMEFQIMDAIGSNQMPSQHRPYIPHVTAGYNVPVDMLTYTGPVEFDRLRVALGDDVVDFQLGGGGTVLASAAPAPPAEWFEDPQLDGPTATTVTADGRAYGHLACWGTCHIGFHGKCVTPPRSASDYAYFLVHSTRAALADGRLVDIPVGYGTVGTGHADVKLGAMETVEHYDNTGTVAFEYNMGEDEHGIWFAGRMLPGLSPEMEHKARGAVFSGDWRTVRGKLELVASLAVNVPGFPVPRVRVASGQPVALVAAGVPAPVAEVVTFADNGRKFLTSRQEKDMTEILDYVRGQAAERSLAELLELTAGAEDELEYVSQRALADLVIALDGDHPWFTESLDDDNDSDGFARKNWVTKAGGLPKYIARIEKHLRGKGMGKSQAIATAVNAAKKMCSSGDTNFPGKQDVNPGSRAEACSAVAEWERKRKSG